ncbi:MAG: cell division protein FtsL [Candidatus Aminicenantales bacterium]
MVRRKFNPREIALGAAFVVLLLTIITFYIWYQSEAIRLGYAIADTEYRVRRMKEEIMKLEAKRAGLLSLGRIEKIAREDLGLTDPKPDQVIYEGQESGKKVEQP